MRVFTPWSKTDHVRNDVIIRKPIPLHKSWRVTINKQLISQDVGWKGRQHGRRGRDIWKPEKGDKHRNSRLKIEAFATSCHNGLWVLYFDGEGMMFEMLVIRLSNGGGHLRPALWTVLVHCTEPPCLCALPLSREGAVMRRAERSARVTFPWLSWRGKTF